MMSFLTALSPKWCKWLRASAYGLDIQYADRSAENGGTENPQSGFSVENISRGEKQNIAIFRKGLWVTGKERHMKIAHKESVKKKRSASSVVLVTIVPVLLNTAKPLNSYKREGRKYEEA